jgi:hypothetical protein
MDILYDPASPVGTETIAALGFLEMRKSVETAKEIPYSTSLQRRILSYSNQRREKD